MATDVDTFTNRPRTSNDQYTNLTDEQIRNIQSKVSPFFHTIKRDNNAPTVPPREGGRYYRDRFCNVTNPHLIRGASGTQGFGWIGNRSDRNPAEEYDTCRGRAHVRWGPNKAGERTRSHFFGESVDRYTTIDMYRRPPTNYSGRVVMDHGRAADGYFAQRNPSTTTWFGSSVPLNRPQTMEPLYRKTTAEYAEIKQNEQHMRQSRRGTWPDYSEYTDKFLLHSKTDHKLSSLQEKKRHIAQEVA